MSREKNNLALELVDNLVADGKAHFTFDEARQRLGRSRTATANLLRRAIDSGLVDRVCRGCYAVRQLGVLGTRVAAEDLAIAVAAAFDGVEHRMAYRTALDEHDLIVHPARAVQVAAVRRMRVQSLSGRPLRTVAEPAAAVSIGAVERGPSWISDLERAVLDAAARPDLAGGAAVLAEALMAAGDQITTSRLEEYAGALQWGTALRRVGSLVDSLSIEGLAGRLAPLRPPASDIDLEPGEGSVRAWRDARWGVRWAMTCDELDAVVRQ